MDMKRRGPEAWPRALDVGHSEGYPIRERLRPGFPGLFFSHFLGLEIAWKAINAHNNAMMPISISIHLLLPFVKVLPPFFMIHG